MNQARLLIPLFCVSLVASLSANRTSANYSIGPETFAGLVGDANSSAYAQFSAVEPLSGLSVKNMPDFKNFASFIGQLPPLDQDGDGLPDSQEAVLGTDKTLADTDADRLTDGEEVSLGTNPLVADSDGDGYSDFAEVQASTNPLLASSNPNQAPSLIDLNHSAVLENQPPQTLVGRLNAIDPDGNGSLSLSLVSMGDASLFLIDGQDNLRTARAFDYEEKAQFALRIRATDNHGASVEQDFSVSVLDLPEPTTYPFDQNQSDPSVGFWPDGVVRNVTLNTQNVRQIFLVMLEREPDASALLYLSQSGDSTNFLVDAMEDSDEFKARLANGVFGSPPSVTNPEDNATTTSQPSPEPEVVLSAPEGQVVVDKFDGIYRYNDLNGVTSWTVSQSGGSWQIRTGFHDANRSFGANGAFDQLPSNNFSESAYTINENGAYVWRPDFNPFLYEIESVENGMVTSNYFYGNLSGNPLGKSYFFLSKQQAEAFLSSLQNGSEPLPQVPTFDLVDNQLSENSPAGSLAGKLLVPDLNGTQTLSFVLSEPSPFVLEANGSLLSKRSFDFESDPASLPVIITATNDANQTLELSFTVTLLNEVEDLDGDGFEDAFDPDIDGDGLSNQDEALAGTDPRLEDTDEDELSDGEEITFETNPLADDSDEDGLTDGTEIGIGTNPLAKDTDGDGFDDQQEVLAGSFPEDANDYPGKQAVTERDPNEGPDGRIYQLSDQSFTLKEAQAYAVQRQGVIPYLNLPAPNAPKDPLEVFLVRFMTRNSPMRKPKAWVLGESQNFFGLERRTILAPRGTRLAFTGNLKLPVLVGYEKPEVRVPYLQTLAAEIEGDKVRARGLLLDDGGEAPFRTGFRISEKILVKESDPTARMVSASLAANAMEALIERLEPGKTYYVRAFAENSAGVTHGAFKRIRIAESYAAPFAGKSEGQGWFRSDWFGLFLPANENWVFHQDFEWIYHGPTNQNGIWFWSERIGWSWTREDVWPYLWMNSQSNWTYYFGKKGGQPTFWDYSNQSLMRWGNPISLAGPND